MSYGYFQTDHTSDSKYSRDIILKDDTDNTLWFKRKYDITYREMHEKGITLDKDCLAYIKPPRFNSGTYPELVLLPTINDGFIKGRDGNSVFVFHPYTSYIRDLIAKYGNEVFTVYLYSKNFNSNDRYGMSINGNRYLASSRNRIKFLELIIGGIDNQINFGNTSSFYSNLDFAFEFPGPVLVPGIWVMWTAPLIIRYGRNTKLKSYGTIHVSRSIPRDKDGEINENYSIRDDSAVSHFTSGHTVDQSMIIDVTGL